MEHVDSAEVSPWAASISVIVLTIVPVQSASVLIGIEAGQPRGSLGKERGKRDDEMGQCGPRGVSRGILELND